jgi:hypothetical protein
MGPSERFGERSVGNPGGACPAIVSPLCPTDVDGTLICDEAMDDESRTLFMILYIELNNVQCEYFRACCFRKELRPDDIMFVPCRVYFAQLFVVAASRTVLPHRLHMLWYFAKRRTSSFYSFNPCLIDVVLHRHAYHKCDSAGHA